MLFWTLQITIISIILIFLVHNLIGFFKSTLTVPKVKDLVNAPVQKYENIYNTLNHSSESNLRDEIQSQQLNYDKKTMKNELKNFLKNKLKSGNENGVENTTSISSLDASSMNSLSFSEY